MASSVSRGMLTNAATKQSTPALATSSLWGTAVTPNNAPQHVQMIAVKPAPPLRLEASKFQEPAPVRASPISLPLEASLLASVPLSTFGSSQLQQESNRQYGRIVTSAAAVSGELAGDEGQELSTEAEPAAATAAAAAAAAPEVNRWRGRRGSQRVRVNRSASVQEGADGSDAETSTGRPKLSWLTDGTMDLSAERTVWRVNRAISRCASVKEALGVVEEMKAAGLNAANEGTYVALINVCRRQRQGERALIVYEAMKQAGIKPGMLTFNTLISCCQQAQRLEDAFRIKADMEALGMKPDVVTYTSLMALVVKTSPFRGRSSPAQRFSRAMELFKEMKQQEVPPDAITFNTLMYAGAQAKLPGKVLELYGAMVAAGVPPNQFTFGILLEAVGHGGRLKAALQVFGEMKACGIAPSSSTYNFLIEACGTAPQPDAKKAWALYDEMTGGSDREVNASAETLNHLMTACCKADDHVGAMRAYEIMKAKKFTKAINVSLFNKLIHSAAAAGFTERAFEIYDLMRGEGLRPDAVTFGTLVSSCSATADVARALTVKQEMEELKVAPNQAFLHALMGVYAKAGQWEEAIRIFREMPQKIPSEPASVGTYAIVFDACFGPEGVEDTISALAEKKQRLKLTAAIRTALEIYEEALDRGIFENLKSKSETQRCDLRNMSRQAASVAIIWWVERLRSLTSSQLTATDELLFLTGSDKGRAAKGERNGRFPRLFVCCEQTLKMLGLRPKALRTLSMQALTINAQQLIRVPRKSARSVVETSQDVDSGDLQGSLLAAA